MLRSIDALSLEGKMCCQNVFNNIFCYFHEIGKRTTTQRGDQKCEEESHFYHYGLRNPKRTCDQRLQRKQNLSFKAHFFH